MADGGGPVLEAWLTSPKTSGRKVDVKLILSAESITWESENSKLDVRVNLCDVLGARFVDAASPASRHEAHASLVIHYVKHVTHKQRRNLSHRCEIFHGTASVCKQWRDKLSDMLLTKFPERPKRLLVFVNPVSGKKNGLKVFQSQAEPFFSLCEVTVDLVVTTHAHHTEEVLASYDFSKLNGIVTVGGDGTYAEAVNGLARRTMQEAHLDENDPELELKPLQLPVGIIPTGTGDGIVEVANTTKDIATAVLLIILGGKVAKDVATVHHGRKLLVYSVLLTGTGLFSEIIRKAESNRNLGRARYVYGVLYGIIKHRIIQVEVDYLPVEESHSGELTERENEAEGTDETGWQHKSGSFVRVDNLTYSVSRSPFPDREALGDGLLRLNFVHPCGRISHGVYVKKWLSGDPDAANSTIAEELKVKAYRVRAVGEWRDSPQSHIINVDGDIVNLPEPDFSVRCHKGVSQLFSWPPDSIPLTSSLAATAQREGERSVSGLGHGANSQEP